MPKNEIIKTINMVSGEKGGVGKSVCSSILIDKLLHEGKKVIVIDADFSNPDVFRAFSGVITNSSLNTEKQEEVEIYQYDLGDQAGWWDLYNLMAKNNVDTQIVISMPAQIEYTMSAQTKEFKRALTDLGYTLNMVWLMSESIDSVQLLKNTTINNAELIDKLIIVKNGFFAEHDEFHDFSSSKLRAELLKNEKFVEVYLPELNKRLKSALKPINKPYSQALIANQLQYSERMGLEVWLNSSREIFSSIS